MPCFSCGLAELTNQYVTEAKTTSSPQIEQQPRPFDATDSTISLLFLIALLTASFGDVVHLLGLLLEQHSSSFGE